MGKINPTQKMKLMHNITGILKIACCMCEEEAETDELCQPIDMHEYDLFASALKGEGWKHGMPKGQDVIGIVCPKCVKRYGIKNA